MRGNCGKLQLCQFIASLTVLFAALAALQDLRAESLQVFVDRLLPDKSGAIIVSDPRTGQVLAIGNPQSAFREAYTPGSTAKLVVGAAALEEGVITPSQTIFCRRVPRLLGESFRCSHPPAAGAYNIDEALAQSCNYFFAELSARLSAAALAHWYGVFGFGAAEQNAVSGEIDIPDKPRGKALAALGDSGVTATPAQVLLAYSAIAMHGNVFSLIMPEQHKAPSLDRVVVLRDRTFSVLAKGLRDCVTQGSCRSAAIPGTNVAGKTGTAPALDGSHVTHAWFVGYAPAQSPEVAVVVFLKRGTGGANAAPMAAQILRQYFEQRLHTP